MESKDIIGQHRVRTALAGSIETDRVSHAYLFYGPHGTGKRAVAISFAAALLCRRATNGVACGACEPCGRAMKMIHPDLHFLIPAPKDTKETVFAERLRMLATNPYSTVDFDRKPVSERAAGGNSQRVIYSVERIHTDIHRQLSFSAAEGGYRVVILSDADRLMTQAANALLKLLEEPRPNTVLILTTDQPEHLLPTIRSRCQSIRFDRLSTEEISEALIEREGIEPLTAATYARMADGSYTGALDLAVSPDLMELREMVVRFLRIAYRCKGPDVVEIAEEMQRMSREQLRFFFQLLLHWLRDIMLQRTLGASATLVNVDQAQEIVKFVANLHDARVEDMIEAVEAAQRLIDRNVNVRLGVIVLTQLLSRSMHGNATQPLIASLSET